MGGLVGLSSPLTVTTPRMAQGAVSHPKGRQASSPDELVRNVREYRDLLRVRDRCRPAGMGSAQASAEWAKASGNLTKARLDQIARAQSRLIRQHLPLVVSVAKVYGTRGVPFADVVQEGALGLLSAAERFDPDRGCQFSTYATWWIRQRVSSYVSSYSRLIRLPSNVVVLLCKADRAKMALRSDLGREPTLDELAAACAVAPEKLRHAQAMSAMVLSMERTPQGRGKEKLRLAERVAAPDPSPEDISHQSQLKDGIQGLMGTMLTSREMEVLKLRFGLGAPKPRSVDEVGAEVQVTRSQVRTIEARALNKLRRPNHWHRVVSEEPSVEPFSRPSIMGPPGGTGVLRRPNQPWQLSKPTVATRDSAP